MSNRSTITSQGPVEIYMDTDDCETICIAVDDSLKKGPSYGDAILTRENLVKLHYELGVFLYGKKVKG